MTDMYNVNVMVLQYMTVLHYGSTVLTHCTALAVFVSIRISLQGRPLHLLAVMHVHVLSLPLQPKKKKNYGRVTPM